jgi:hypothetical protein
VFTYKSTTTPNTTAFRKIEQLTYHPNATFPDHTVLRPWTVVDAVYFTTTSFLGDGYTRQNNSEAKRSVLKTYVFKNVHTQAPPKNNNNNSNHNHLTLPPPHHQITNPSHRFGDVVPTSTAGRLYTAILHFASMLAAGMVVGAMMSDMVRTQVRSVL